MTVTAVNMQRLVDERARIWETEGKPLADIAATRDFTAEETQTWERVNGALGRLQERLKALEVANRQEAALEDMAGTAGPARDNDLAAELRSVLNGEVAGIDLTFGHEVTRALGGGAAGTGGATVPSTFWSELVTPLRDLSSIIQAGAQIITTASGEPITVPRLATPGAAVQIAGEAAQVGGTDPTFNQATLGAYDLGQAILTSRNLVEDSAIDIEGLIGQLIGENVGVLLGQRLATGTGSGQTLGLATAATVGKTGTAATGLPTFDELIDLYFSITAPYRVRAAWVVADQALAGLRKAKDANEQYLCQPAVAQGQPDTILGKPVYADANLAAGNSAVSVLFGDYSRYWVRLVNSLRIERSDHAAFLSRQVAFLGYIRADGALIDTSAVKSFKGKAAA
ncbi:MAG: phage major capsid protein [Bifidobacteriaceae bacterium]|nr:phage major capsid protein [Bifidobacteriaceae bacterium]